MQKSRLAVVVAAASLVLGLSLASEAEAFRARTHEPIGFQMFESPQVDPIVLSPDGNELYVANTLGRSVAVISVTENFLRTNVEVGVDPVSLAVRPGGDELWVSNHVSDTVSVIDLNPASATRYQVIDTIQDLDANGVTRFDEPVGIAFTPDGAKAYVALSSRNQVAVIDAATRAITARLNIRAQEPRALAVRNGLLYVAAFESGNQSELSACPSFSNPFAPTGSAPQCTLSLLSIVQFATNPNLPGAVKNIVLDPQVPDRDLFVFDTSTDTEVAAVSGVGTLLYDVVVSTTGRVFISQTDARNAVNGLEGQNLVDLGNRMFDNEVAAVTCTTGGCGAVTVRNLEPGSPTHATAFATPYGIGLSGDDSTLVVTAAGSSRVATLSASTLATLDVVDLGSGATFGRQIPRGVAVLSGAGGAPQKAYVFNATESVVSVIDVSNPGDITESTEILLFGDPTPPEILRGKIAFHSGFASTTGTFSCGSCHPDAHTDQMLWRIGGACSFAGCSGDDEPRSTMPIRGLKNTLPLHWDGTLGDPFGGPNGETGNGGNVPAQCSLGGPDGDEDCFRHLVDGSLSGVMCSQAGGCANGPSGLPGQLTVQEREDLAAYMAAVVYPPARSRRLDDTISTSANPVPVPNGNGTNSSTTANARKGFEDFFTNQGGNTGNPDTCADSDAGCHELPLGAATNSATLQAFEAPTMRGMTDRWLQFSLGPTNPEEVLQLANSGGTVAGLGLTVGPLETPIRWDPNQGHREVTTFGSAFTIFQPVYNTRPLDMFQMFEEASTGFSGAQARQVQLNVRTTTGGALTSTHTQLAALELAEERGLVNVIVTGVRNGALLSLSYRTETDDYRDVNDANPMTRTQLTTEAAAGTLIATATAQLRSNWGTALGPQPLLDHTGTGSNGVTGDPPIPTLASGSASNPPAFTVLGTNVRANAVVLIDGVPVNATVTCSAGVSGSFCNNGNVSIDINQAVSTGLRLLQVQNELGPLSNELPVCVGSAGGCT